MAKAGKAKMLEESEVAAVLAAVAKGRYPERDQAAVLLAVRGGLRVSEIAGLSWANVMRADGSGLQDFIDLPAPIVKRKTRARTIPMNPELKAALEALRLAFSKRVAPEWPVIWSERGGRYTANGLSRVFVKWFQDKAGLAGCSAHSGRRSLLTKLARTCGQHGGSLEDVRQIAGHSDIRTTQVYLTGSAEAQCRMLTA